MMTTQHVFDFCDYFDWAVSPPIPLDHAIQRVGAYCTDPKSGWGVYDVAAVSARRHGYLDAVTPWSLLLANALNGRVQLKELADFTPERRKDYASRLVAVRADADLAEMGDEDIDKVVAACGFGYPGVWGPKITKVGALFRPLAVPVLDGHVARAFGLTSDGFSAKAHQHGRDRPERISLAVRAFARLLGEQSSLVSELRRGVVSIVPEVECVSDLRLIDIVIWTSQDDRFARPRKPINYWLEAPMRPPLRIADFEPMTIEP